MSPIDVLALSLPAATRLPASDVFALIAALDPAGIAITALSGALLAARMRQTFVTMAFFALVTGVGGGTVRDLLIGAPVFWVHNAWTAPVCLGAALLVWFSPARWWQSESTRVIEWADAAGLGAYAVLGTAKALALGVAPVPAAMMGVITGCVGGVIRDVIAGRPSIIMRPELYVTPAALTSALCAGGHMAGVDKMIVWPLAALAGFGLRGAAIQWQLALPAYGRTRDKGE
ncbi:MAG: trimeric intracellular cation channel family protein [Sphingomonadales bacterium]|uniref:trimeric intracellular cation channel family protein n=1 Tax=Novosphingobium sp. NDB2Meth1 TaxID=1892847 RepID=UPI0009FB70C3|nr:trimeric intracellular cation channel family protein [Novosphingobium sp. NDB2Meth1]MBU6395818.1 trimeric intracellular cation channel family protein [Sphingomonadales bacterium]MBY0392523.1 trimeric intracellular cation channel family protein [Novosphingobium sp.]